MPIIPVADFAPDQAAYRGSALQLAKNTLPREDGSDAPLQAPAKLAAALPAPCRGACMASAGRDSSIILAGTASKLYRLNGTAWNDISGAATFAVPDKYDWRFTQFGTRLIATNYVNAVQSYVIGGGGNVATLAAGAPKGRYVATVEPGFLMLGDLDAGIGTLPNAVGWSALNDATQWPTWGTQAAQAVQSDYQQLPLGDAVQGILPAIGGAQAAVFTERSIYRVEYVGSPTIFAFREADRSRGCYAPGSLVQVGPIAYFLSEEGFSAFDGQQTTSIGFGRVDRFFWDDVDTVKLHEVRGIVNPLRRVILWHYTRRSGAPRWLIYSYANNRWRLGDDASLMVQAWVQRVAPSVDSALVGLATEAFGLGGRLLSRAGAYILGAPGERILIGSVGPATFSAAFDASNQLVGYAGAALAATLETGETDFDGRRVFVSGLRPLTDSPNVQASVGYRDSFNVPVSYTTPTTQAVTGTCPARISTRYGRARLEIPAGERWTYLQGVDVQARPEGRR